MALADVLTRCNWAKRILFLADRVALVKQAVNAFKTHLPDASPVNLVTERHADGRVFVSTYPTMMRLIDDVADGQRRFGVGHFDLIIIDEAHRSVYQKYRAIFDYFDTLLVGRPCRTMWPCVNACRQLPAHWKRRKPSPPSRRRWC